MAASHFIADQSAQRIDQSIQQLSGTTVLAVRRDGRLVMGGDGQVSLGATIVKGNARKVRRLYHDRVLAGFAGATADAFTLHALRALRGQARAPPRPPGARRRASRRCCWSATPATCCSSRAPATCSSPSTR